MRTKKSASKNLENKKTVFFQIGLIVSLLLVFYAFQWKQYEKREIVMPNSTTVIFEVDDIPLTFPDQPKPPPPPAMSQLEIVDDTQDAPDVFFIDVSSDPFAPVKEYAPVMPPPKPEEVPDERIFIAVEEMPEFPGGEQALISYLASSTNYPHLARSMNIQGTVFVSFVVETDGSISNVELTRGIGGGCDEEALRVISGMPQWKPGKQSGRPVRVSFSSRIVFRLQ